MANTVYRHARVNGKSTRRSKPLTFICSSVLCPNLTFGKVYNVNPNTGSFWDDKNEVQHVQQLTSIMEEV